MKSNSENKKIRKTYFWDNSNVDYIYLPNSFFDDFLLENDSFADIPINALRVIFNIVFIIRNDQFRPENRPRQLSLFENEFETENNVFAQLCIKNINISPSGSSHQIRKAYEYLVKYKMEWYKSLNSKGLEIKSFGGLISNPSYDQRGHTTFLISQYWLRKIMVMSEYNTVLYNLVYNVKNNKHVLFALWLEKIPTTGTSVRLSTFNKKFRLNYSNTGDFCTKFLLQVKKILDEKNTTSFTYKYKHEYIHILPCSTDLIRSKALVDGNSSVINIKQRLKYFKKRFEIMDENFESFIREYSHFPRHREMIEESYKQFVKNCRKRKFRSTAYKDKVFTNEMQSILIEKYLETKSGQKFPKGFPIIS